MYWDAYDLEWLIYFTERDLEKKAKDGIPSDDWLAYFDAVGAARPGSVKCVYPTRALGPGKPPLERHRHWLALSGYGASLWNPAIAEMYDGVPVRAEWQKQYSQAYDAALEELARRKALGAGGESEGVMELKGKYREKEEKNACKGHPSQ